MEAIVTYFETIPSLHRTLLLVSGLTVFWLAENALPLFEHDYHKWKHAGMNFFFTFTTIVVNFAMAFILVLSSRWVVENDFGLLQWVALPLWAQALVGLLVLDLIGAYFVHYTEHRVKWMWRFHLVHHTDRHVDTTTANRHHPGESVIRFVFTTAAVILIGAPIWLVFLYQALSVILTQFNHANISMPEWLDRALRTVICTPNMHRVHHHYRMPYTDSNFGNIFSFWDRIFGTYIVVDNSKLIYGVDVFMAEEETDRIGSALKIPFMKYRAPIEYEEEERL